MKTQSILKTPKVIDNLISLHQKLMKNDSVYANAHNVMINKFRNENIKYAPLTYLSNAQNEAN